MKYHELIDYDEEDDYIDNIWDGRDYHSDEANIEYFVQNDHIKLITQQKRLSYMK